MDPRCASSDRIQQIRRFGLYNTSFDPPFTSDFIYHYLEATVTAVQEARSRKLDTSSLETPMALIHTVLSAASMKSNRQKGRIANGHTHDYYASVPFHTGRPSGPPDGDLPNGDQQRGT